MSRFKHEFDRDKTEQGAVVALAIAFENDGYKEDRLDAVRRRAIYAAELRER